MSILRKRIPVAAFIISSLWLIVAWYTDYQPLVSSANRIMQIGSIATAFALTLGALNLIRNHGGKVQQRTEGQWQWSAYLLIVFIPLALYGIVRGPEDAMYNWIYQNINTPLSASMWGLLAPYILTASFRAFRLKNFESYLMTICVVAVLLMNAPIGGVLWTGFPAIGKWISTYVQTTGQRVFVIGVALGTIALYMRTLVGKETAPIGFGGETET